MTKVANCSNLDVEHKNGFKVPVGDSFVNINLDRKYTSKDDVVTDKWTAKVKSEIDLDLFDDGCCFTPWAKVNCTMKTDDNNKLNL